MEKQDEFIVLVDCDGVMANFIDPLLDNVNVRLRTNYTPADVKTFQVAEALDDPRVEDVLFDIVEHYAFVANMEPMPGAIEAIDELRKVARVITVTSPYDKSTKWMPQRYDWLKRVMKFNKKDIIFASSKEIHDGDFLIEDSIENLYNWASFRADRGTYPYARVPILFNKPYNLVHELRRSWMNSCDDWTQIVSFIKKKIDLKNSVRG